jgi:hypothetical protein
LSTDPRRPPEQRPLVALDPLGLEDARHAVTLAMAGGESALERRRKSVDSSDRTGGGV